eukprot:TRINITY_DN74693_c0_g1_i1.p1 TRINITY_DN74693_c0_g1~~TRINITY_DN74693_c0_g1_i1.p1  ORF type:complete len:289 (-),score=56.28 TRINITY_DN74693_c0_g1_i1:120-965(-)
MDKQGVRKLYETKHSRPMTQKELELLDTLTVRDIIRIWENLSFGARVLELHEFLGAKEQEEEEAPDELPPVRKKILTDINRILEAIKRLGTTDKKDGFGLPKATFKTLREDSKLRTYLDSVAGACRLGRKEGLVFFKSRDLVLGKDDGEWVVMIEPEIPELTRKKKVPKKEETEKKDDASSTVKVAAPAGGGGGGRMRGGSVRVPVNDAEIDALVALLTNFKADDEDMLQFGTLRKNSKVKELFATKFPKVLQAAKRNGRLEYDGEDLWPDKDDAVKITLK